MDWSTWVLLGATGLAFLGWWMWRQRTRAPARVIDPARERVKLPDMIPPVAPGAAGTIFRLSAHPPVRIRATSLTDDFVTREMRSSFDAPIRDALWVQQRQFLTRLESELEIPLQAELSGHFVIVTGTNQTRQFLGQALADAERVFATLKDLFQVADPLRLWLGRAMIVLFSNRRHFDHVAWLTGTKVTLSSEGAYMLAEDRVVFMPLYMSLASESRRAMTQQIVRAWLHCSGGIAGDYPRWVAEGLGRWVEASLGEWVEGQVGWVEDGIAGGPVRITAAEQTDAAVQVGSDAVPAQPPKLASSKVQAAEQIKILFPAAWERADIDPPLLESLRETSYRVIDWLMTANRPALLLFFKSFKAATSEDAAWRGALQSDAKGLVTAFQASGHTPRKPTKTAAVLPRGITAMGQDILDRSM